MSSKPLSLCFLIILTLLSGVPALGQNQKSDQLCGENGQGMLTGWYYDAVLQLISPPDSSYLISISFSHPLETKYILRMMSQTKFELLRGAPEQRIHDILQAADRLCRLPLDPSRAVDLIHIHWDRMAISQATFERLHRDFTAAVAKRTSDADAQYGDYLKGRGVPVYLHTEEFSFSYHDRAYRITVDSTDSDDERGKKDLLNQWAHAILKLAEENFPKK